jgi:hypothetical protein
MIFDAEDFSTFEFCPRKPELERIFRPPRYPIRDAAKLYFKTGVRGIMAGESPEDTTQAFIAEASVPGYVYPESCEHFTAAKDFELWLDGALRLAVEECGGLQPLPLYQVDNHDLHVEGWLDSNGGIHLLRVAANLGERALLWPELCILALAGEELDLRQREIAVHIYRLPSIRNGRLLSPLNMAYEHPSFKNIRYRLARLYDDDEFNKNWHKRGRWEIQPNPTWEEWRLGIERDKALPLIREIYTISPKLDSADRQGIIYDIAQMMNAQEKPSIFPRYREHCVSCIWNGLCHGSAQSRAEYQVAGREELARYLTRMAGTQK